MREGHAQKTAGVWVVALGRKEAVINTSHGIRRQKAKSTKQSGGPTEMDGTQTEQIGWFGSRS